MHSLSMGDLMKFADKHLTEEASDLADTKPLN